MAWWFRPGNGHPVRRRGIRQRVVTGVAAGAAAIAVAATGAAAPAAAAPIRGAALSGVNLSALPPGVGLERSTLADLTAADDRRLALATEAGFNLLRIRVPIAPWLDGGSADARQKTLALVHHLVDRAVAQGTEIILVLFAGSEPTETARAVVCEQYNRSGFTQALAALVETLPDRPQAGVEPLNEPPDCAATATGPRLQEAAYQDVRRSRPAIRFVASGGGWGTIDGLARLDAAPYRGDAAVWFSFHFYEPLLYTHQEITWLSPGSYRYVSRLPWPEDPHRTGAALVEALRRLADDATLDSSRRERLAAVLRRDFADYATAGTAAHVARRFDEVTRWAGREHIPPTRLLLGEYGVDRPTHSAAGAPWPDAAAWLGAVHGEAVRRGFMPVVWDLDSGFAVICQHEGLDAQLCEDYRRALR